MPSISLVIMIDQGLQTRGGQTFRVRPDTAMCMADRQTAMKRQERLRKRQDSASAPDPRSCQPRLRNR